MEVFDIFNFICPGFPCPGLLSGFSLAGFRVLSIVVPCLFVRVFLVLVCCPGFPGPVSRALFIFAPLSLSGCPCVVVAVVVGWLGFVSLWVVWFGLVWFLFDC